MNRHNSTESVQSIHCERRVSVKPIGGAAAPQPRPHHRPQARLSARTVASSTRNNVQWRREHRILSVVRNKRRQDPLRSRDRLSVQIQHACDGPRVVPHKVEFGHLVLGHPHLLLNVATLHTSKP